MGHAWVQHSYTYGMPFISTDHEALVNGVLDSIKGIISGRKAGRCFCPRLWQCKGHKVTVAPHLVSMQPYPQLQGETVVLLLS